MKTGKRIASLLLAGIMCTAVLGGCSKSDTGTSSGTGDKTNSTASTDSTASKAPNAKKVKITALFPGQASKGHDGVMKAVNEKLAADGLNIEVKVNFADDYWNKLALDCAAGTEYDIAWAHSSTLSDFVAKKIYQPIDDAMASNGAELKANMKDHVVKAGSVDGKMYAIPRSIPMTAFNNVWNIRGDLRVKYGIEPVTTIEGFEKYLDAIAKNEPDMYPLALGDMRPVFPPFADYYFPLGDGGAHPIYVDPEDSTFTVKSFWDSEAFTKVCETKKSWRDKGWQPADTSRVENGYQGFNFGIVSAVPANIMTASEIIDNTLKNVPGVVIETVLLEPKKRRIYMAGDNMLAVPITSKHPNEAIAFINWFKKDQTNYDLWSYGVEGVNYKLTDNAIDISGIPEKDAYSMNIWMWNDSRLARFSANYPKEDIEALKTWDDGAEITPFVGFVLNTSKIKSQLSQIQVVMEEYYDNLGLGVLDINKVRDEIMKKMNAAGLQDVIKEAQTQIDAYVK